MHRTDILELHIRSLTPEDESFLRLALYHALYVPPGVRPYPVEIIQQPELVRYVTQWMQQPGDLGVVSEIGAVPVGAAWLRCWQQSEPGFGFIDEATPELSISLLPAYRGRGIGTALLSRLLSEAAQRFDAVSLSVTESNPARRLYERLGFIIFDKSKGSSMTMVKRFVSCLCLFYLSAF